MGQFICGECLEKMKKIKDETIDFIITSPPYADQIKNYGVAGVNIKPSQFNSWFIPRAKEMFRILKHNGSFVLNINDKLDGKYQSIFVFKLIVLLVEQVGFHLVRDYIWYNPATPPNVFSRGTMGRTKKSHEYCFWFSKSEQWVFNMDPIRKPYGEKMLELFKSEPKGDRKANSRPSRHTFDLSHRWKNKGGSDPGSVLSISNTSSNDTFHRLCKQFGIVHPARFPESLVEFFVKAGTNEGDVVLDPFGGSGTTAIVAKRLKRDFKYIEINQDYCMMAQKWFDVEFNGEALYAHNMDCFFKEMIQNCKYNILPFDFLYDLYISWLPTAGYYEKKQTKKIFIERLKLYINKYKEWSIGIINLNYDKFNNSNEDLVLKYGLKKWKKIEYKENSIKNISNTKSQKKIKGIYRNET